MGKLLEPLLKALLESSAKLEVLWKAVSEILIRRLPDLLTQLGHSLRQPEFLAFILAFLLAALTTAILVILLMALHRGIRRRRARVFISFEHEREPIADRLAGEMAKSGLIQMKLPFVEDPNHDELLDQVKHAIRDCDVFVCLPGSRPSFVESEVSMAFGLEKPMLFVIIEEDSPKLPNTAKKGYPVFSLERLRDASFRPLLDFCSYLAADRRSTLRLYGTLFEHFRKCMGLVPLIYVAALIIAIVVCGPMPELVSPVRSPLLWLQSVATNPLVYSFAASCLAIILILYAIFFLRRLEFRRRICRAISSKKFREEFLPDTLEYGLTKDVMLSVLCRGDLLAHHEAEAASSAASSTAWSSTSRGE